MLVMVVVALAGLAVGSFLDSAAGRLRERKPLFAARSRCDGCGTALGALDLVPVRSYLLLRGRCRYCSMPISARAPLVEAAGGALALTMWMFAGR
ncbi:MAG: prepilin peptidase [Dehalococcoidia bacterium]